MTFHIDLSSASIINSIEILVLAISMGLYYSWLCARIRKATAEVIYETDRIRKAVLALIDMQSKPTTLQFTSRDGATDTFSGSKAQRPQPVYRPDMRDGLTEIENPSTYEEDITEHLGAAALSGRYPTPPPPIAITFGEDANLE